MSPIARVARRIRFDVALLLVAYGGLLVLAHPDRVASLLGLSASPWEDRLFFAGMTLALLALAWLGKRLLARSLRRWRSWRSPAEIGASRTGTVIVEFALALPLLLLVSALIVQMALIANASLVVRYSAFAAARTAIVRFEAPPLNIYEFERISDSNARAAERAAELVLATISPASTPSGELDARTLGRATDPTGVLEYTSRVHYAKSQTQVTLTESEAPWIPDAPHLVPPFSEEAPPGVATPVIWQPPSSLSFTIKLADVLKTRGISLPVWVSILQATLKNFPIPKLNLQAGDWKFTLDFVSLAVTIQFPIPDWVRQPFIVTSTAHPFPKEVEAEVTYGFLVTFPGMNLVPGLTKPAPPEAGGYGIFEITRRVRLQSTGIREGSPLAILGGDLFL